MDWKEATKLDGFGSLSNLTWTTDDGHTVSVLNKVNTYGKHPKFKVTALVNGVEMTMEGDKQDRTQYNGSDIPETAALVDLAMKTE